MTSDYPSDWNSRRKQIMERDEFTCQNCGIQGGSYGNAELHAHHVVPKSRGGSHDVSNLISLCSDCHQTVHSKNAQAPTHNQQQNSEIDYSNPDYLTLVDKVLNDTLTIMSVTTSLLRTTGEDFSNDEVEYEETLDVQNDVRVAIVQTFEHIDLVESIWKGNYPDELVETINQGIEAAEKVLEKLSNPLNLVENCLIDCHTQEISCPACGTSIDEDDTFCGGCGSEIAAMKPSCPACDAEVNKDDKFCRDCGNELEEYTGPILESTQIDPDFYMKMYEQSVEIEESIDQFVESQIQIEIQYRISSESQLRILWEYCPSCGFPNGVLRSPHKIECIVCNSEWVDRGSSNHNLEMTTGDQWGESQSEGEWAEMGEQRYQEQRYQEYL